MGNIYLKILFSALPQIVFYYTWPPPQRILLITHRSVCPLSIHRHADDATLKICHILHYFWTCTLVAFHNFFRSDYIGNQTCAWRNESWPATLNVLFSQIRQWTECLVCDARRWWDKSSDTPVSAWCVMHGGGGILFSGNTADTLVRVGRQLEQAAAICQHIGVQCSYLQTCPLFIPAHYAWACQLTLSRN